LGFDAFLPPEYRISGGGGRPPAAAAARITSRGIILSPPFVDPSSDLLHGGDPIPYTSWIAAVSAAAATIPSERPTTAMPRKDDNTNTNINKKRSNKRNTKNTPTRITTTASPSIAGCAKKSATRW
jgi:hypothetical protein